MSRRPAAEAKWDVASRELLRELIGAPLPLGLRVGPPLRTFHRDIYYDTPDGALGRREITCRFRIGADDRRQLLLTIPDGPAPARGAARLRFEAVVTELDLAAALGGTTEPARRLRGLVDPSELQPTAELEVDRAIRVVGGRWPWQGRYELLYDAATVRHGGLRREFQELKARRLRRGSPSLDALSAALAYFVSPVDVVPDVIPLSGFIDDAAVLGLVFGAVEVDLRRYCTWCGLDAKRYFSG